MVEIISDGINNYVQFSQELVIDQLITPAFVTAMQEEIEKRIRETHISHPEVVNQLLEEDAPDALRRELTFASFITERYQSWSQEESPVVLWDIDRTMGILNIDSNKWRIRPSLLPLVNYLSLKFPKVTNGILTNRPLVEEDLLRTLDKFIDPTHIYTNSHKTIEEITELREKGINLKLIDDYPIAKTLGKDGAYVRDYFPSV